MARKSYVSQNVLLRNKNFASLRILTVDEKLVALCWICLTVECYAW